MRGRRRRRVQAPAAPAPTPRIRAHGAGARAAAVGALVTTAVVLASCGSGPAGPGAAPPAGGPTTTATPAPTASTLPPVAATGPLQAGAPIALPFSADRVTAAESPDGAVFAAPQAPTSPAPSVAWVVDGNGPAAVAEHVATGIAAMAADGTDLYVATYAEVYAFTRSSGDQNGQWTMPPLNTADSSNDDLVSMTAAAGAVYLSVDRGNTVDVYRIDPSSSAPPPPGAPRSGCRRRAERGRLLRKDRPRVGGPACRWHHRQRTCACPHAERARRRRAVHRQRRGRCAVGQRARRPRSRRANSPRTTPRHSVLWAPTTAR